MPFQHFATTITNTAIHEGDLCQFYVETKCVGGYFRTNILKRAAVFFRIDNWRQKQMLAIQGTVGFSPK